MTNQLLRDFILQHAEAISEYDGYIHVNPTRNELVLVEAIDELHYSFSYTEITDGGNLVAYSEIDITLGSFEDTEVSNIVDDLFCNEEHLDIIVKSLPLLKEKVELSNV